MSDGRSAFGAPVPNWSPRARPPRDALRGRFCTLEPLETERHAGELFDAYSGHDALWNYLPYGPFQQKSDYFDWCDQAAQGSDPQFFAVRATSEGRAVGVASYLRIDPANGSIEAGHLCFSPALQRTVAATETLYLMMANAFDLGYRRFEWKCDALNLPSRRAAQRLGMSFEGVFRQAAVVKGRNRDTAWFSVIDAEWPLLKDAFGHWLAPENFDDDGQQKVRLSALTRPLLAQPDPAL